MRTALQICDYWVAQALDSSSAIAQLKQRLLALESLPKQVTLVSAGEVSVLLDPVVIDFCHWLKAHCQVTFISAACTSLHAAILDFNQSDAASTVVISLELEKTLQQGCLDSLGIGVDKGQDGLDVVPSVGFIMLDRGSKGGLAIEQCQILSQQIGLNGTTGLIRELLQLLNNLDKNVLPVSFNISSLWGKSLLRGLTKRLGSQQSNWLASAEQCGRHYLSLKPLFELQLYQKSLDEHKLLLMTLGGGGRVGILQLGQNTGATVTLPPASCESYCLSDDIAGYCAALALAPYDKAAFYQQMRTTLKYPRSRYRGRSNHYFKWSMDQLENQQQ
jgi:hypothetical protein